MIFSTLCYIEQNEKYLMLHRVVKKNDVNKDKWIGVGGKFEEGESPEDCLKREVKEETGLTLTSFRFRGILSFFSVGYEPEYICFYTADGFKGDLIKCEEGTLEWVKKTEITNLNLWEGDRIFHRLLLEEAPFFSLKLRYEHNVLIEAVLNGTSMELVDLLDENNEVTGIRREREVIHREGGLHRTSHVWLVRRNEKGEPEILLQKRAKGKDAFPGCYDISSAGHIPAGVGYRESAVRELEEELGVKVAPEELLYIGQNESKVDTVFYGKPFRNHETSAVYVLDRTGVSDRFILQESEVEEVKWMNFETCRECLEDPEFPNCIMGNETDLLQRYFEEK